MGLRLEAYASATSSGAETRIIGYRVMGLTPNDVCLIRDSGGDQGPRMWQISWFRDGSLIFGPEETFATPERALAAVQHFARHT